MLKRSGGDEEVWLRKGDSRLAPVPDQEPPAQKDVFAYRQDAVGEHRTNLQPQPIPQIRSTLGVWVDFRAVPYLSDRDAADEKAIQRLYRHKA